MACREDCATEGRVCVCDAEPFPLPCVAACPECDDPVPATAPQCQACTGFERHNSGRCTRAATVYKSNVGLCDYHDATRRHVPLLYLAEPEGMAINRAGVVGFPAELLPDAGTAAVDALVRAAEGPTADEIAVIESPHRLPDDTAPAADTIPVPPFMSTDSATRKLMPVYSGFASYFPDAMLLASWISTVGAKKHCAGVLGWDKSKSVDEPDAGLRHALDAARRFPPDPGLEPLAHLGHLASKFWRAGAELQRACDEARRAFLAGEEWRK